jgi:hypothetical protein
MSLLSVVALAGTLVIALFVSGWRHQQQAD